jgi:pyridoxamine 5'-phosphate oxidase
MAGRFDLEKAVAAKTAEFGLGEIARPAFWSGFRIAPAAIEFWVNRPFRLHDRLLYARAGEGWTKTRLYP